MPPEASPPFPRMGNGTRPESESVSTACLEAQRNVRAMREGCGSDGPLELDRWPAGPPWGVALCLAQQKAKRRLWVGPSGPTTMRPRKGLLALKPQRLKPPIPRSFDVGAKAPTHQPTAKLAVRQHFMNVLGVRRMHQLQFLQPAHPVGLLGAQQVPLPGMHSQNFSRRRDLETLGGAPMRLQLELLYLFCHKCYLVRIFSGAGFT
jgi:hypothetical protein